MAVTPNYGWPIPVATDYVKDGWEAISDLGDAIDTTLSTFSAGALTLINSTSFSSSTGVNLNNVFTSTYDNYLLVMVFQNASAAENYIRFRVGGVDNTSNYYVSYQYNGNASYSGGNSAYGNGYFNFTGITNKQQLVMNISDVAKASNSYYFATTTRTTNTQLTGCEHQVSTAYDGISIYPSTGNFTGTVRIYGYQNS